MLRNKTILYFKSKEQNIPREKKDEDFKYIQKSDNHFEAANNFTFVVSSIYFAKLKSL